MNKSLYLALIFLFTLSSCGLFKRENHRSLNLTSVVQTVMEGKDSTSKLYILRDKELPPAANPNSIAVDTFRAFGKRYYSIVAEYPDPVYNRFAIIDSYYNVLLMDKSLNGYIAETPVEVDQIHFVKVVDSFVSKGVLGLKRVSLYSVADNGEAELVFRTYTELSEPGITYKQDIDRVNATYIATKIYSTGNGQSKLEQDQDVFHFSTETNKYTSYNDYFNAFVLSEVQNFEGPADRPEITSRESYLKGMGIVTTETTTEHKLGNFSIPLTSEWNEVKNVKITDMLKRPKTGTKFINNHYGAEISIIQLPLDDSSESFIKYPLENISSGNYRVRFSEKISGAKYFYQFFEYSCGEEKFLLILQTLKTTYELYKADYQTLINSFSMDC